MASMAVLESDLRVLFAVSRRRYLSAKETSDRAMVQVIDSYLLAFIFQHGTRFDFTNSLNQIRGNGILYAFLLEILMFQTHDSNIRFWCSCCSMDSKQAGKCWEALCHWKCLIP